MKILILGAYYSSNLGDGVICESVAYLLHKHFHDAEITIKDLTSRRYFDHSAPPDILARLDKERKKDFLRQYITRVFRWDKVFIHEKNRFNQDTSYIEDVCQLDADIVVIAGGQLFMDRYALFLEAYINRFTSRNIPVFINACGTGNAHSPHISDQLSTALSNPLVPLISCRDNVQLLNKFYMKKKQAITTYDPALWCNKCYSISKNPDTDIIGLGIMYVNNMSRDLVTHFWIQLIQALEKQSLHWKLFINGAGTDYVYAQYVFEQLTDISGSFEEHFVPIPEKPENLVQMIADFKSIISFRLHSHIIAASLDIPSIAIVWDQKVPFFFEKIEHPERCCTINEHPDIILSKLTDAQETGYNHELLQFQKDFSDQCLYQAIIQ